MKAKTPELDENTNSMSFLAETAIQFASSGINHQIYSYIAQCLSRLNPKAIIIVNSIDIENGFSRTEELITPWQNLDKIASIIGFNPKGKTLKIDHSILELESGNIRKFDYGIHELSFKTIPQHASRALEVFLNLGNIYGIAFMVEGKMYANATLLLPKDTELAHNQTIETFARQASVTLKRIEAEQNEERYRALFEFMSDGAFYLKADGSLIDVNNAALKILGLSREEFLNIDPQNPGWRAIDENMKPIPPEEFSSRMAIKTGQPVKDRIVGAFNKQKQSYVWMNINAIPEFEPGSTKPHRVFVTMHDITEQKRKQEELEKSEEKWRKLVQTLPEFVALYDKDDQYIFLNRFAIGFSARDIEGKSYADFMDNQSKLIYDQAFKDAKQTKATQFVEHFALGENNALRQYESYFVPIFENDLFVNMMVIARDITDRKDIENQLRESEANARAIMESTDDVIILLNQEGIIIDCNEAHAKRLNTTREELLGKNVFERLPKNLALTRSELVKKTIATGKSQNSEDLRNGHWNEVGFHPIIINDKISDRVAVFARDITQRKLAEEELKKKNEDLFHLNMQKDTFFSIIAHDLKNPFNSILGFCELLNDEARDLDIEAIVKYASVINSSARQAFELLENLLEWARMQQGRIPFEPKKLLLNGILDDEFENLSNNAKQKNIQLKNLLAQNIVLVADENMLHSILRNLISNAVKFTPRGGHVEVEANEEHGQFVISIKDTGIGIKPEFIDKLFKAESNFTTRGTENEKGTGLGLLLCKEFIEKHGGKIWVESKVGKGSTFFFTLGPSINPDNKS